MSIELSNEELDIKHGYDHVADFTQAQLDDVLRALSIVGITDVVTEDKSEDYDSCIRLYWNGVIPRPLYAWMYRIGSLDLYDMTKVTELSDATTVRNNPQRPDGLWYKFFYQRNGMPVSSSGCEGPWKVGEIRTRPLNTSIDACSNGYHASDTLSWARSYVVGPFLGLVRLSGNISINYDKVAARTCELVRLYHPTMAQMKLLAYKLHEISQDDNSDNIIDCVNSVSYDPEYILHAIDGHSEAGHQLVEDWLNDDANLLDTNSREYKLIQLKAEVVTIVESMDLHKRELEILTDRIKTVCSTVSDCTEQLETIQSMIDLLLD